MLDLGLIGRRNYYTGAVYEAYSPKLGFTVASGGRYDNLLERFGDPLPATGFAISLERLLSVMPDRSPATPVVLIGRGVEATRAANDLRDRGVPILHLAEDASVDKAVKYASSVDAFWVCYPVAGRIQLASLNGRGEFIGQLGAMEPEAVARKVLS